MKFPFGFILFFCQHHYLCVMPEENTIVPRVFKVHCPDSSFFMLLQLLAVIPLNLSMLCING